MPNLSFPLYMAITDKLFANEAHQIIICIKSPCPSTQNNLPIAPLVYALMASKLYKYVPACSILYCDYFVKRTMIKNADIKKEVQKAASGKNVQQLFSYVVLCGIFLKKFVRKFIHYKSQLHLGGQIICSNYWSIIDNWHKKMIPSPCLKFATQVANKAFYISRPNQILNLFCIIR